MEPKRKWSTCRAFLVLWLLLFLQFCLFVITILISYAVESGVAHLHHTLFDLTPPLPLETSLMLYCVSLMAECITEVQHKNWNIISEKNHYIMLTVIPNIIYILLFSLAFINIFVEFKAFHSIDHWHFGVPESNPQTALYMLSISYLIFCLTRAIRKDMLHLFSKLPHHQHAHSVVLLVGFVWQFISTVLYSLPIFIIALTATLFKWHVATEFTFMNSMGVVMGILGSYAESKIPIFKKRGKKPYFWYENIIYSRVVFLEVILLPSVHYLFFEPRKLNFLYTKDRHVIYFTFCVAISLTHVVKILTTSLVSHRSADLIFGWSWGRPSRGSRNHMSQSGIDGGFLRQGDENDDNDDDSNSNNQNQNQNRNMAPGNPANSSSCDPVIYIEANINTNASNNQNAQENNSRSSEEGGLPTFSWPRNLVQTPLAAIAYYGFKFIHKIERKEFYEEDKDFDEIMNEQNCLSTDNTTNSDPSFLRDIVEQNSEQFHSMNVFHSEDINCNENLVPGIVNKGEENNFHKQLVRPVHYSENNLQCT